MALMLAARKVCIEEEENYIKSTFRNRCEIKGANGSIELSIPLLGGRDHHQLYKETVISYEKNWQHRHRMSILSCYGSAPFFEHYMPVLEPFYQNRYPGLFDYNKAMLELLVKQLKLDVELSYTEVYHRNTKDMADLRLSFKPGILIEEVAVGQERWCLRPVNYSQVFNTGGGQSFYTSCLDLLFNEGPQARDILQQIVQKA